MIRDLTNKANPCPICGSKRIYSDYPTTDVIYTVNIYCADCGLKGFKNFLHTTKIDDATQIVLDYWNKREESL